MGVSYDRATMTRMKLLRADRIVRCDWCGAAVAHDSNLCHYCELRRDGLLPEPSVPKQKPRRPRSERIPSSTRVYGNHKQELRNMMLRDPCAYCGEYRPLMTIDHIVPSSQGGPSHIDNFTGACADCNGEKADRSLLVYLAWKWAR